MAPEHESESAVVAEAALGSEDQACELLRTASHDLRSPLTVIQLLVRRAERRQRAGPQPPDGEWLATLSRIDRVANHALALIEDVLGAGRPTSSRAMPVAPDSAIDVEDVIAEALLLQEETLSDAKCDVTVTRKRGLERAQGHWNRGCLLRIFCNLLQNASKYAPASPVRVQLARAGDRLRIVFADRGPGISVRGDEQAAAYVDDGAVPTGPHGLGLWIVRRGVAELNGSMKIRSAPGVGLAFAIELPGLLGADASQSDPPPR
jgi:two-component system, OmpR family, sensor histidine kinase KdpD